MSSSKLFVIHQDTKLFTIQTVKHALIITSMDDRKIQSLANTIYTYNKETHKLLNKCRMYQTDSLHIYENEGSIYTIKEIAASYIDINDEESKDFFTRLYDYNNVKLFYMENFDFDRSVHPPLLCIQGVTLEYTPLSDASISTEDHHSKIINYLEGIIKKT